MVANNLRRANNFGVLLRRLRRERGHTMRSLGALIGVSAPYLSDVEHGHRAGTPDLARRVASVMGVDVQPWLVAVALDTGRIAVPPEATREAVAAAVAAVLP